MIQFDFIGLPAVQLFRIHCQYRLVFYASEAVLIGFAVDGENGWLELEVPSMTMLTLRHEDERAIFKCEFCVIPLEIK